MGLKSFPANGHCMVDSNLMLDHWLALPGNVIRIAKTRKILGAVPGILNVAAVIMMIVLKNKVYVFLFAFYMSNSRLQESKC